MRPLHLLSESAVLTLSKVAAAHCQAVKASLISDLYISNNLINGYVKCRDLRNAQKLFDDMPHRDTVSWNTVIAGNVNRGSFGSAWGVLKSMKRCGFLFDAYTFGSVLKGVGVSGGLLYGLQVHSDVVKMGFDDNVYAASALLDMYAKRGRLDDARKVFECMPWRNTVSWNALMAGYAEIGDLQRCIELLVSMEMEGVRMDDGTFAPLMTLLCNVDSYELLRQLHGMVMKHGLVHETIVFNAMITAYAECGCIEDAERVFDGADAFRDLVTWNSMLAAYLEHGLEGCGFDLFLKMVRQGLELDAYSYSVIISSCFGDAQWGLGKSLHCLVIKRGFEQSTQVSNALVSMYTKHNSQSMEDAWKTFERLHVKDLVSWNTILTGLSQNGMSEDALRLFQKMRLDRMVFDQFTFTAILRSCSDLAILKLGQQIHVLVVKSGLEGNEFVASGLIFMYSKCGIIEDAWKSFEACNKETSVTWNSIIFAHAQHGQGKVALDLFYRMTERRVKLDHITFVAAVTACSHIGLVEEGLKLLKSMEAEYRIPPRMENYACAIDLLGRAGRLLEAEELIGEMPFEPDLMVWKTLLGACRACGDIQLATQVAGHLLELDPGDHCTYVLLSDMYGQLKRWDKKASVTRLMRDKGVKKVPGWSWIELGNDVYAFNADDHSHPISVEIYNALKELTREIRKPLGDYTLDGSFDDLVLASDYPIVGADGPV
ncbi:putative pentatricopeptide repeat-containing protein At3g25970 [Andrographis paniculata]|uniref:putative pentatricopeptide repeat-containing protein At3g25970 n=1 Tax=Andrographis paniculata TaxID=175694 RepID=UPI0021E6FF7C|nr:putative pentatricopeptide repeat-containing protein At3g25970 [Andrographis paniculata]XP_051151727.1 putative pentatricopeptide repeat-containing protein At3g25970 [Andrographis paniculata]